LSRPALDVVCAISNAALLVALFAFSVYTSHHPDPTVPDGFRGYLEPQLAFHRQLAFPAFVTLTSSTIVLAGGVFSARGEAKQRW
jgi:hypothetical protein